MEWGKHTHAYSLHMTDTTCMCKRIHIHRHNMHMHAYTHKHTHREGERDGEGEGERHTQTLRSCCNNDPVSFLVPSLDTVTVETVEGGCTLNPSHAVDTGCSCLITRAVERGGRGGERGREIHVDEEREGGRETSYNVHIQHMYCTCTCLN